MEVFAKCARCGATVGPCDAKETARGTRMRFWAAATTCTVDADGGMALDLGGATVLCPDCMEGLKQWLAGQPQEPQGAADSAEGDDVKALARDMARGLVLAAKENCGDQAVACGYFGYWGVSCVGCGTATCPAFTRSREGCFNVMSDEVGKRCKALGIDIEEDADAK